MVLCINGIDVVLEDLDSFFFFFVFFFLLLLLLLLFLGPLPRHMEVPRLGVELWPEPQQRGIRAASAAYTTAHDNAGSLTH